MKGINRELRFTLLSGVFLFLQVPLAWGGTPAEEFKHKARIPEDLFGVSYDDDIPGDTDGNSCALTEFTVNEYYWVGGVRLDAKIETEYGRDLKCLDTKWRDAAKRCKDAIPEVDQWRDLDDCIILGYFMHIDPVVKLFDLENVSLRPASIEGGLASSDWYFRKHSCDFSTPRGICKQGTIFFDDDCNSVTKPSAVQLAHACDGGSFNWATPISLVWDENTDVDQEIAFTQFPLEPGFTGENWYTWKASEKTPLLVYDPKHTGEITSAEQLFGSWTFGGQRSAAQNSSAPLAPRPWENGFQALKQLDQNHDGVIEGSELAELGLWFDKNRDGVSQAGEVISLTNAGVTKLYPDAELTKQSTKTLVARRGYERISKDGTVSGTLADWYGESGKTQMELIQRQNLRSELCQNSATIAQPRGNEPSLPTAIPEQLGKDTGELFQPQTNLSGVWNYRIIGDSLGSLKSKTGHLTFSVQNTNELVGYSIIGAPMGRAKSEGVTEMAQIQALKGKFELDANSALKAKFEIVSDEKAKTSSEAVLSSDGKTLSGSTESVVTVQGKPIHFSYKWVAERL